MQKFFYILLKRCMKLYNLTYINRGTRRQGIISQKCSEHHTIGIGGIWHCGKIQMESCQWHTLITAYEVQLT